MIVQEFTRRGYSLYKVLPLCGLSKSSCYYLPFCGKRGMKASSSTLSKEGIRYSNEYIHGRGQSAAKLLHRVLSLYSRERCLCQV